jgi:hypothetical protein
MVVLLTQTLPQLLCSTLQEARGWPPLWTTLQQQRATARMAVP